MNLQRTPEQDLARWIVETEFRDVPKRTIDVIKFDMIDTLGCGLFGSTSKHATIVRELVKEIGGKSTCVIWGTALKAPPAQAAMANEMAVHAYDFDDMMPAVAHPGGPVLSSAVAVAEGVGGVSGKDLLTAMAVGFETAYRVAAAQGSYRLLYAERGFYATSMNSAFASVATAGKVFGLDEDAMARALSIAGTHAFALYSATTTKRYCTARIVQDSVHAAILAKKGLDAPLDGLTAGYSGFLTTISTQPTPAALTKDLERGKFAFHPPAKERPLIHKYWPTIGSNHATIQALGDMMRKHPEIKLELIDKIRIGTNKATYMYSYAGTIPQVETTGAAMVVLQWAGAAQIVYGDVNVETITDKSKITNPKVRELIPKFEVYVDEELDKLHAAGQHERGAKAMVRLKDGTEFNEYLRGEDAKGLGGTHMTKEDMLKKYRFQASRILKKDKVEKIIETVEELEKLKDVRKLARLLAA